jgi:hypothetical protein
MARAWLVLAGGAGGAGAVMAVFTSPGGVAGGRP